jgi:hypothetical protein
VARPSDEAFAALSAFGHPKRREHTPHRTSVALEPGVCDNLSDAGAGVGVITLESTIQQQSVRRRWCAFSRATKTAQR